MRKLIDFKFEIGDVVAFLQRENDEEKRGLVVELGENEIKVNLLYKNWGDWIASGFFRIVPIKDIFECIITFDDTESWWTEN